MKYQFQRFLLNHQKENDFQNLQTHLGSALSKLPFYYAQSDDISHLFDCPSFIQSIRAFFLNKQPIVVKEIPKSTFT